MNTDLPPARRLAFAPGRALLAFLERRRDTDGVLRRRAFTPEDLRPWLGGIAIQQWRPDLGDYVYRLFGTYLAQNLGRDLSGRTVAEWPLVAARAMRDQADAARARGVAIVSHYRLRVAQRDGRIENRVHIQEKIVFPFAYGEGPPDAVLTYVDQGFDDIPLLRDHMDASDGSCWCTVDRPVCAGCPFPTATAGGQEASERSFT